MADATTCHIYRSSKKEELYLFLAKEDDFECVPAEVIKGFGKPQKAMVLELTPETRMARSNAPDVLANLKQHGFHLQLPPAPHQQVDAQLAQEKK